MTSLIAPIFAAVVALFVPGYLILRILRFSRLTAAAASPLASCVIYGVLPILYDAAHVRCDIVTMFAIPCIVLLGCFLISAQRMKTGNAVIFRIFVTPSSWRSRNNARDTGYDWAILLLYLGCGIAVGLIAFVANLGSPEAFFSRYDNQTHLNLAQAFVDSGQWCALHHKRYAASLACQIPMTSGSGSSFYPTTWHALVALVTLMAATKVTIASNALVFVVAAIVFPAGMYLLMRALFGDKRMVIAFGALASVAFATYPWVFAIKGPTFPNMLGYAVMLPFMAVVIGFAEQGLIRAQLPRFVIFMLIAFASMAIAHTNSLFTAFVFLAAYGGHYIWKYAGAHSEKRGRARTIAMLVYLAAIAAFWAFCITTPILHGVVGYNHIENNGFWFSLKGLLLLTLTINSIQYAVLIVVIVGIIGCIRRRMWWILVPIAYMAFGYFISRYSAQPWLTIFMGLWYSLPYRAAACLCIFLMPVAALGFTDISRGCAALATKLVPPIRFVARYPQTITAVLVVLFALATYAPVGITIHGHYIQTPYNSVYGKLAEIYKQDANRVYGAEEVAFVDKALAITGKDALVINQPNDGSLFAYGVNHMNAYYRSSALKRQTDDSNTLRKHLNEYATNQKVQEAVRDTGASYVLQLDQGVSYENLIKLPQYYKKNRNGWIGIDRIRDDTPGFTCVLAEGDMRLYRIDDLSDETANGSAGAGKATGQSNEAATGETTADEAASQPGETATGEMSATTTAAATTAAASAQSAEAR